MTLVDTSVWVAVFRARSPLALPDVVDLDDVATCPPVLQEVLQGFRDERLFRRAREAMLAVPIVEAPLGLAVYGQAVELYRSARRAGIRIRSTVDCLIAACALRNDLEVLHLGRDFAALARIAPLRVRVAG
jgi:predicted nucleic acid-binding protein